LSASPALWGEGELGFDQVVHVPQSDGVALGAVFVGEIVADGTTVFNDRSGGRGGAAIDLVAAERGKDDGREDMDGADAPLDGRLPEDGLEQATGR